MEVIQNQGSPGAFVVWDVDKASPNGEVFRPEGEMVPFRRVPPSSGTVSVCYPGLALSVPQKPWVMPPHNVIMPRQIQQPVPKIEPFERERQAFLREKDNLLRHETYVGKFVAFHNGSLVDYDKDVQKLAKRIYEKWGYVPIYIGKIQKRERTVSLPSPER